MSETHRDTHIRMHVILVSAVAMSQYCSLEIFLFGVFILILTNDRSPDMANGIIIM